MALPLVRILSKVAPVMAGAFELYRRRQEAKEQAQGLPRESTAPEALRKRIQELETSDVEQARLISELSTTVEVLASSLGKEIDDAKRREQRLQRALWIAMSVAVLSASGVIWLALR